jgi:valyl-tRNA synthetase
MLDQIYNAEQVEKKWQEYWEKEKVFKFNPESKKPIFSIDTPPPTVSGNMHIGHSFMYSQMDFIARYKRMSGFELFYPFGTDDNGLATDRLIEKIKNVKSALMDRNAYIKLCLDTLNEIRPDFISDWKRAAISCDYDIFYSTINDHCRKLSQKSFIDLYKMGREYRKEGPTIWCAECGMAIAQVEMKDKELESKFHEIIFKLENGKKSKDTKDKDTKGNDIAIDIVIATTRPELIPACVALFAHPDDERYKSLFGKKAKVPLFDYSVPIMASDRAKPDKGTGILMCCTFGDQDDIEHYKAFNLPLRQAITKDGKMTEITGKYKDLKIRKAREAIVADLKAAGLHVGETKIKHNVNVHERCGTEIEIMNSKQWFIKYLDLKDEFLRLGREMKWYPGFMINRYENWINGLQWDWSLSRQRHYGVPIPVWYCAKCGQEVLADEKQLPVDPLADKPLVNKCPDQKCGHDKFIPEKDVLDTWATSSLTPQIAASLFPKMYNKLYPMNLRPQAHDIISFWLFNTVVKSYLHEKKAPWDEIMISGWVLDPLGDKMSKSKGNVIEPRAVMEKYSADALRFWAASSKLGEDLAYQEKELVSGKKTITKLWNAAKLVYMNLEGYNLDNINKNNRNNHINNNGNIEFDELELMDKWLFLKFNNAVKEATELWDDYNFSEARKVIELFFWRDFCDNYLEIVKHRLYNAEYNTDKDKSSKPRLSAQHTLYNVLLGVLKLFAPIMPFITEELYQAKYANADKKNGKESASAKSLHLTNWPAHDKKMKHEVAEQAGELAINIISEVRKYKATNQMSLKQELAKIVVESPVDLKKLKKQELEAWKIDVVNTIKAKEFEIKPSKEFKIRIG